MKSKIYSTRCLSSKMYYCVKCDKIILTNRSKLQIIVMLISIILIPTELFKIIRNISAKIIYEFDKNTMYGKYTYIYRI